ncbi:MAG: outer membrane beta-barrel family protein [Bacteroidota bacterium]
MNLFTKKLYYICLMLLPAIPLAGFAQAPKPLAKITGTIVNEQNKPVEFATVSLLRAKDSAVVKGALGNDAGLYTLNRVAPGNYIIKTTMVGYNRGLSKPFAITPATVDFKAPAITMQASTKTLSTVNVQSTRPLIERKLDRLVMNVENSVLAAGNSAMEILERAPGVSIDKDDNISLNGKGGVTVMINDKLTYLSAAQLATMLRATDGSNIQSVEIITNPSAKYDASGNSGIINIKLKKNRQVGTNGSVTLGAGYGKYGKDNESLNLNHKEGKLNAYGNFNHNDNKRMNDLNINRVVDSAGTLTYFKQHTGMLSHQHNNSYLLGADYDLTDKHTIGFVLNGYNTRRIDDNDNINQIGSLLNTTNSYQTTNSELVQTSKNFALNLNDRLQLDTLGQALAIDLDYSKFNNNSNAFYNTFFYTAAGAQQKPQLNLRNQTPSSITIKTAKADYTYPLSKTLKLETGVKFSDVKTDNDLQAQIKDASGSFINDTSRTNHFIYQEKIDAGYINLGKTYKNSSVQLGVRAEYTSSLGDLINGNQVVGKRYLDFFPSVFINHTLSAKHDIGVSYSRRIDRPSYDNLNPFIYYLDQYTYQKGNPFLTPQYTNSFEFHYTYNKSINVTLGYSHTTDIITQIILTDPIKKASFQTNLNLQQQNAYSANIDAPYTIAKWWTGNANLNAYYLGIKSNGLLGGNLNDGQFAYQARATQTLTPIKGYRFEVTSVYRSSQTNGIFKMKPQYATDAGVSHPFANKKANLKLSMSDIFNTRDNRINSMYQTVNISVRQKSETRVTRLTFTYNFGNNKIKIRQHKTGANDESNRAGSGN